MSFSEASTDIGLPTVKQGIELPFRELAESIRTAIGQIGGVADRNAILRHLRVVAYILARKIQRKPRVVLTTLKEPKPPGAWKQPKWPKPLLSGKSRTPKSKLKGLLLQLEAAYEEFFRSATRAERELRFKGFHDSVLVKTRKLDAWAKARLTATGSDSFMAHAEKVIRSFEEHKRDHLAHTSRLEEHERKQKAKTQQYTDKMAEWRNLTDPKGKILERIEREIEELQDACPSTELVNWTILPSGELDRYFQGDWPFEHRFDLGIMVERRTFVRTLEPKTAIVGKEGLAGYRAYRFEWTKGVLVENENFGNAAYIFCGGWERLMRMDKQQLRKIGPPTKIKVVHDAGGNWKQRILECLRRLRAWPQT